MRFFILIASVIAVVSGQDLSNCKPGVQALCQRKNEEATACLFRGKSQYNTGDHRNDPDFKKSMLERHNFYRSKPYTGSGGPVSGADIVEIEWDDELEINAWIWANQLAENNQGREDGNLTHDTCRATPSYDYVNQNIAWAAGGDWSKPINVDEKAVRGWNAENASVYNASILIESFPGAYLNGIAIGHYTQLMWAKSYRVGCAYVTGDSETYTTQGWIVCDYGVGGNLKKTKVFEPGTIGSKCLEGSVPGGANGLCKVNDVNTFRKTVNVKNSA